MPFKDVDITVLGEVITANPDSIRLSHGQGHTLNWHNKSNEEITITFDKGSPFNGGHPYHVPAGQHRNSGAIKVQPGPNAWKYTIRTASGKVKDPDVIIDR